MLLYIIRKTLLSSLIKMEHFQNQDEQEQVENVTDSQVLIQQSEDEEGIICYCGDVKCVMEMKIYHYIKQTQ